jgi:Uncharacterised nucleotidyltransferase
VPEASVQLDSQIGSREAELLFATARVRISQKAAERIRALVREDLNWIHLIQLAMQHETTALLYWNLQRLCPDSVPAGVLKPLAARYNAQASEAQFRAGELVRILAALDERGLLAVAYKGPVLSQRLYGSLGLREFSKSSDLDLLVRQRDLPKAKAVIVDYGYEEYSQTEREWIFRQRDSGRFLELQWHFTTHLCRVPDDPERFIQRFETVPLGDATVRSLPLEVYFLVLCLHATKHKWRTLKLICDIAEILASPEVDWDYVVRQANALGVRRMLALGVLLSQDPLGVPAPQPLLRGLKIDRAARQLAAQCRAELLKEPDDRWRLHADIRFMLKARERRYDEMKLFFQDWLWPETMPDDEDRRFLPIPRSLSALYYVVRPMRLVWKEITERG